MKAANSISGRDRLVHLFKEGVIEKSNSVSVDRRHKLTVRNQLPEFCLIH